jgi:propanol-preferring alcohol dehydrogenase
MRAMVMKAPGSRLELQELADPVPGPGDVRLRVRACGVCRTDLHVLDGELMDPRLPLVPGHQIVGIVDRMGEQVQHLSVGQRVGVPWLGGSCESCSHCRAGRENLCDSALYTGYQIDGGFAELCVADARYCFPLPEIYTDAHAAPLLCAGLIGYRSYRMTGDAKRLGFYGFGAAAHLLIQLARAEGREVYVFTRPGDDTAQRFAIELGAVWAGSSKDTPPVELDASILFAPVGELVPQALAAVRKGGTVVCAGIHMSDIPSFPYSLLWSERVVRSVANLTRRDGIEYFERVHEHPVESEVHRYPLERANDALDDLRHGRFTGAAVIEVDTH